MIDGELPEPEVEIVRQHISGCIECGAVEKDYLFFRGVMRTPDSVSKISTIAKRGIWTKGISIPVPVFTGLILLFAGVVTGLFMWKSAGSEDKANILSEKPQISTSGSSISRFDRGGRTEIYVAKVGEK